MMTGLSELSNRFDSLRTTSEIEDSSKQLPKAPVTSKRRHRRRTKLLATDFTDNAADKCKFSHDLMKLTCEKPNGQHLSESDQQLEERMLLLRPRGFRNHKNCCYLNVCLQLLLHIPPVANVFNKSQCSSFKEDSLCRLMFQLIQQFIPASSTDTDGQMARPSNKNGHSRDSSRSTYNQQIAPGGPSGIKPYELGPPISADERFVTVLNLGGGAQEDGAECLTQMLTRLHEELGSSTQSNGFCPPNPLPNGVQNGDDDGDWFVADRTGKNRPVARKTELQGGLSRIAELFCGSLVTHNSVNRLPGGRLEKAMPKIECRSTKEPFFILPLNIDDPNVTSIESALLRLSAAELVTDYRDSSSGTVSNVNRRLSIDHLPPYLVLQLTRFSYDHQTSRSGEMSHHSWVLKKSLKQIVVPSKLTIPAKSLSPEHTFTMAERKYTLQAVVFHLGQTAASGHYTIAIRWCHGSSEADSEAFLYLDDTRACLVEDTSSIRLLLSTHRPLDATSFQFLALPVDVPDKSTPAITKQPRTPYLLVYESGASTSVSGQR